MYNQTSFEIINANDYYPFGMNHLKTGNAFFAQGSYKSNKYNGKELQETGMYSYGWREYMPDIGRWNAIDQLAENYLSASPYAYVLNNPVNMFDPNGLLSMMALTQAMWDQTPDGTNSYWQNNNLGDSDSGGKPGGAGSSFVYVGGTAGLQAGYGIGSTLDMNGNFNSYYGSVTNGVLNYMYWTNGMPASGNAIQGMDAHKGSLDLNPVKPANSIDWYNPAGKVNWFIGAGGAGVGNFADRFYIGTARSNTPVRFLGQNFYGNGRTFIKATHVGTVIGRFSFGLGVAMDGVGVYNYYYNTTSENKVHPAKAGLNTVIGAYGLTGAGTIPALLYFGVDAFYPGGWEGYGNDYQRIQSENSAIVPGFITAPYGSQKF